MNTDDVPPQSIAIAEEEQEKQQQSKLMQFWLENKKYLPYILLILAAAYSLAAFIIDFERARVLFIIEMIAIGFHAIKFVYGKWFSGSATRLFDKFAANRRLVIVINIIFICLVLTVFILCSYHDPGRLVALLGLIIFILSCWAFR